MGTSQHEGIPRWPVVTEGAPARFSWARVDHPWAPSPARGDRESPNTALLAFKLSPKKMPEQILRYQVAGTSTHPRTRQLLVPDAASESNLVNTICALAGLAPTMPVVRDPHRTVVELSPPVLRALSAEGAPTLNLQFKRSRSVAASSWPARIAALMASVRFTVAALIVFGVLQVCSAVLNCGAAYVSLTTGKSPSPARGPAPVGSGRRRCGGG